MADQPSSHLDDEARNRQVRLDQMLEAKMISDILRANNNLKALKAFRVQNEANYKEKELAEIRKKEIREPLEAAVFENDIMTSKLERRDDIIRLLRRELIMENIKTKLGSISRDPGSMRMSGIDIKDNDELKQVELQDQIGELNIIIQYHQGEVAKCKKVIEIQFKKIKSLRDELEQSEYSFNERIKKIDSDKEIYLGMIESRENKIEKFMEDLDEVNEELSEANEALETAKIDKKNAVKLMEEYKVKAVDAMAAQDIVEKRAKELDEELKVLREDHCELTEKYTDVQSRYDNLVVELDKMVQEGYYIPEVKVTTTTTNKKESNSKRKNKTIKAQDIQKVSKKFPKMKSSNNIPDDTTTINSDPSVAQLPTVESSSHIHTVNSQDNTAVDNSIRPSSSGKPVPIDNIPAPNTTTNTNINVQAINDEDGPEEDSDDDNNDYNDSQPTPQRVGRFSMRKLQEDNVLNDKLEAHAATRIKEVMQQQIVQLENQIQQEKQARRDDQAQAMTTREGLQLGQKVLTAEISRLTSKISEQEKTIASINEELQISQAANKFAGLRQSELVSRLSSIHHSPNAPVPRDKRGSEYSIDALRDMFQLDEANENKSSKKKEYTDIACGPDQDDYVHLDVLGYMRDWENVQTCSKSIQVNNEFGSNVSIQFDEEDFFETMMPSVHDEYTHENDNSNENTNETDDNDATNRPASRHSNKSDENGLPGSRAHTPDTNKNNIPATNSSKVQYKVLKEDPEIASQFEQLYQGFLHVCCKYLPPHKQQLLAQEFTSSLAAQELVPSLDINWQVRNTLTLVTALNEMRNQFVSHCFQNHQLMRQMQFSLHRTESKHSVHDEEKRAAAEAKLEKANLRIVLTVRFMDLILQVVHYLLSPLHRLQESEYPLLEKLFPMVKPVSHTQQTSNNESSDVFTQKLKQQAQDLMDTFPLTEIALSADPSHGSPRGILSMLEEYQKKHRGHSRSSSPVGRRASSPSNKQYMNRSTPRSLPINVDELLELIEKRSRSNSPSTHSRQTPVVAPPSQEMDLGSYILAQYDKEGMTFLDHIAGDREKPPPEVAADDFANDVDYKIGLVIPHSAIDIDKMNTNTAMPSNHRQGRLRNPNTLTMNKAPPIPIPSLSTRYKPHTSNTEYVDYTRLAFDKNDIISNAYTANHRRVHSANAGEQGSRGGDKGKSSTDATSLFPEIDGIRLDSRPFSATSTPSDDRPYGYLGGRGQFPLGGLETIASVAEGSSVLVEEGPLAHAGHTPKPPHKDVVSGKRAVAISIPSSSRPSNALSDTLNNTNTTPSRPHAHRTLIVPGEASIATPSMHSNHHDKPSHPTPTRNPPPKATTEKPASNSRPGSASSPTRYYQPRVGKTLFNNDLRVPDVNSTDAQHVDYVALSAFSIDSSSISSRKDNSSPFPVPAFQPPAPLYGKNAMNDSNDSVDGRRADGGGLSVLGKKRITTGREKVTGAYLHM